MSRPPHSLDNRTRPRRRAVLRLVLTATLAAPLLSTCAEIATRSVINGFFQGMIAELSSILSTTGTTRP